MDWKPKVAIVGAGGMGALFGAILQSGGLSVKLIDLNARHVRSITENGLRLTGYGGDRTVAIDATTEASSVGPVDVVLIQCKARDTTAAARSVRHLIDGGAVAISFQNGWGNEVEISDLVGPENVLGGTTAMAGLLVEPALVKDFSRVPSAIGEMVGGRSERVMRIAEAFSAAGLPTKASEDVVADIWKKLLGNIAMSALSGITNMTTAQCLAVPSLKKVAVAALEEALAVATSLGIVLDRQAALAGMESNSAAGGTGDTKSSLCVDLLNRRPTEVDVIYESVIALGRKNGVATPTLNTLAAIVRGLESRYLSDEAAGRG